MIIFDQEKKQFWIFIFVIAVIVISVVLLILVTSGVLPNVVNDVLCAWFNPSTRRWLGDACN